MVTWRNMVLHSTILCIFIHVKDYLIIFLQLEPPQPKEMKLPQALEKVLAFKDERAQQVGVTAEEIESMNALPGM